MKNLFNDISQDEKNRILEMHSGKKNVISEQDKRVNHNGMVYISDILKPFGFSLDTKSFGVPTVYKGDDSNGVNIQFYQDKGYYLQLSVSKNNKQVLLKKYPITSKEDYTSDSAVKQILIDVEKWKNYKFPKSTYVG